MKLIPVDARAWNCMGAMMMIQVPFDLFPAATRSTLGSRAINISETLSYLASPLGFEF